MNIVTGCILSKNKTPVLTKKVKLFNKNDYIIARQPITNESVKDALVVIEKMMVSVRSMMSTLRSRMTAFESLFGAIKISKKKKVLNQKSPNQVYVNHSLGEWVERCHHIREIYDLIKSVESLINMHKHKKEGIADTSDKAQAKLKGYTRALENYKLELKQTHDLISKWYNRYSPLALRKSALKMVKTLEKNVNSSNTKLKPIHPIEMDNEVFHLIEKLDKGSTRALSFGMVIRFNNIPKKIYFDAEHLKVSVMEFHKHRIKLDDSNFNAKQFYTFVTLKVENYLSGDALALDKLDISNDMVSYLEEKGLVKIENASGATNTSISHNNPVNKVLRRIAELIFNFLNENQYVIKGDDYSNAEVLEITVETKDVNEIYETVRSIFDSGDEDTDLSKENFAFFTLVDRFLPEDANEMYLSRGKFDTNRLSQLKTEEQKRYVERKTHDDTWYDMDKRKADKNLFMEPEDIGRGYGKGEDIEYTEEEEVEVINEKTGEKTKQKVKVPKTYTGYGQSHDTEDNPYLASTDISLTEAFKTMLQNNDIIRHDKSCKFLVEEKDSSKIADAVVDYVTGHMENTYPNIYLIIAQDRIFEKKDFLKAIDLKDVKSKIKDVENIPYSHDAKNEFLKNLDKFNPKTHKEITLEKEASGPPSHFGKLSSMWVAFSLVRPVSLQRYKSKDGILDRKKNIKDPKLYTHATFVNHLATMARDFNIDGIWYMSSMYDKLMDSSFKKTIHTQYKDTKKHYSTNRFWEIGDICISMGKEYACKRPVPEGLEIVPGETDNWEKYWDDFEAVMDKKKGYRCIQPVPGDKEGNLVTPIGIEYDYSRARVNVFVSKKFIPFIPSYKSYFQVITKGKNRQEKVVNCKRDKNGLPLFNKDSGKSEYEFYRQIVMDIMHDLATMIGKSTVKIPIFDQTKDKDVLKNKDTVKAEIKKLQKSLAYNEEYGLTVVKYDEKNQPKPTARLGNIFRTMYDQLKVPIYDNWITTETKPNQGTIHLRHVNYSEAEEILLGNKNKDTTGDLVKYIDSHFSYGRVPINKVDGKFQTDSDVKKLYEDRQILISDILGATRIMTNNKQLFSVVNIAKHGDSPNSPEKDPAVRVDSETKMDIITNGPTHNKSLYKKTRDVGTEHLYRVTVDIVNKLKEKIKRLKEAKDVPGKGLKYYTDLTKKIDEAEKELLENAVHIELTTREDMELVVERIVDKYDKFSLDEDSDYRKKYERRDLLGEQVVKLQKKHLQTLIDKATEEGTYKDTDEYLKKLHKDSKVFSSGEKAVLIRQEAIEYLKLFKKQDVIHLFIDYIEKRKTSLSQDEILQLREELKKREAQGFKDLSDEEIDKQIKEGVDSKQINPVTGEINFNDALDYFLKLDGDHIMEEKQRRNIMKSLSLTQKGLQSMTSNEIWDKIVTMAIGHKDKQGNVIKGTLVQEKDTIQELNDLNTDIKKSNSTKLGSVLKEMKKGNYQNLTSPEVDILNEIRDAKSRIQGKDTHTVAKTCMDYIFSKALRGTELSGYNAYKQTYPINKKHRKLCKKFYDRYNDKKSFFKGFTKRKDYEYVDYILLEEFVDVYLKSFKIPAYMGKQYVHSDDIDDGHYSDEINIKNVRQDRVLFIEKEIKVFDEGKSNSIRNRLKTLYDKEGWSDAYKKAVTTDPKKSKVNDGSESLRGRLYKQFMKIMDRIKIYDAMDLMDHIVDKGKSVAGEWSLNTHEQKMLSDVKDNYDLITDLYSGYSISDYDSNMGVFTAEMLNANDKIQEIKNKAISLSLSKDGDLDNLSPSDRLTLINNDSFKELMSKDPIVNPVDMYSSYVNYMVKLSYREIADRQKKLSIVKPEALNKYKGPLGDNDYNLNTTVKDLVNNGREVNMEHLNTLTKLNSDTTSPDRDLLNLNDIEGNITSLFSTIQNMAKNHNVYVGKEPIKVYIVNPMLDRTDLSVLKALVNNEESLKSYNENTIYDFLSEEFNFKKTDVNTAIRRLIDYGILVLSSDSCTLSDNAKSVVKNFGEINLEHRLLGLRTGSVEEQMGLMRAQASAFGYILDSNASSYASDHIAKTYKAAFEKTFKDVKPDNKGDFQESILIDRLMVIQKKFIKDNIPSFLETVDKIRNNIITKTMRICINNEIISIANSRDKEIKYMQLKLMQEGYTEVLTTGKKLGQIKHVQCFKKSGDSFSRSINKNILNSKDPKTAAMIDAIKQSLRYINDIPTKGNPSVDYDVHEPHDEDSASWIYHFDITPPRLVINKNTPKTPKGDKLPNMTEEQKIDVVVGQNKELFKLLKEEHPEMNTPELNDKFDDLIKNLKDNNPNLDLNKIDKSEIKDFEDLVKEDSAKKTTETIDLDDPEQEETVDMYRGSWEQILSENTDIILLSDDEQKAKLEEYLDKMEAPDYVLDRLIDIMYE
jgi:hypothetical protein